MATSDLPAGYTFHQKSPDLSDYIALRASSPSTLTRVPPHLARVALLNSYHTTYITHTSSPSKAVAMGRIVGDGGWYFSICDVVVLPEHQRKGLGRCIMAALMAKIKADVLALDTEAGLEEKSYAADDWKNGIGRGKGAYVGLGAAPEARKMYAEFGFRDTMPDNQGMGLWTGLLK